MENNLNTVNLPLTDYNILKSNLETTKDLLNKATIELDVLKEQQEKNKIVVVEKTFPGRFGGNETVERLKLFIDDPKTSEKILDIISKIDNSELSDSIENKEVEIRGLKARLNDALDSLEAAEKSYKYSYRREEDAKKEEIRKLKKGYEETILELEIDKETLTKSLADLKVNKTKEQLELERQKEIDEMREEILALEKYKFNTQNLGFFSWRRFVKAYDNAKNFLDINPWINELWHSTRKAVDNIKAFTEILKEVGKLPEKEKKPQSKYDETFGHPYQLYTGECIQSCGN